MGKSKKTEKTESLEAFVKDTQESILKFAEDYKKSHKKDPEHYPLELPEGNSGLWFEFFIDFCERD